MFARDGRRKFYLGGGKLIKCIDPNESEASRRGEIKLQIGNCGWYMGFEWNYGILLKCREFTKSQKLSIHVDWVHKKTRNLGAEGHSSPPPPFKHGGGGANRRLCVICRPQTCTHHMNMCPVLPRYRLPCLSIMYVFHVGLCVFHVGY